MFQGSHYCSRAGTYIMQWRVPETTAGHSSTFDFGSHKCRLIYYYEILNSENFRRVFFLILGTCFFYRGPWSNPKPALLLISNVSRGSVASLESCRSSSFSSIAPPTPPTPGTPRKS
ncbi:hypothetical protein B9Z55_010895 [Caenorhabditis nigoni]|uniref:Uncharacterized protein n=1 Tax=Caenorhabditis nigoni TaxID=1611254 RepID=A0A2G5UI09_9PELO|nr:hypothetical protein B9Z55_010895 [Caenorhabditis nigoni]